MLLTAGAATWWLAAGGDDGSSNNAPATRIAAIVAHWDAYSEAWENGRDEGVAFIVEHNMYDAGPEACGVAYPDGHTEVVRADRSTIVRADDWAEPWPDRLAREATEIYELTVHPDGFEPLTAHIAFVDGAPRHYFGCHPDWLGAWEADDRSAWIEYSPDHDRFHGVSLDLATDVDGPCAGNAAVSTGWISEPEPDSFVVAWQRWCGSDEIAAQPDIVRRRRSDGTIELVDRVSGATFVSNGDPDEVTHRYDDVSDTLSDRVSEPLNRSTLCASCPLVADALESSTSDDWSIVLDEPEVVRAP